MIPAMQRHDRKEATVVPIILRAVNWQSAPFARLQALPKDGVPVTLWEDKDSAWTNVEAGIRRAVDDQRKRSR